MPRGPISLKTDHVISSHDSVPHFKDEVSTCDPLNRNKEIESWIHSTENLVHLLTGEAFIMAARANCRGKAETIINSGNFDIITDFKRELRQKFRGHIHQQLFILSQMSTILDVPLQNGHTEPESHITCHYLHRDDLPQMCGVTSTNVLHIAVVNVGY